MAYKDLPRGSTIKKVDSWVWQHVPSTVGYQKGVGGEVVIMPGAASLELAITQVWNWRSGEHGVLAGYDLQLGGAVGENVGADTSVGLVAAYGASTIEPLSGGDYVASVSGDFTVGGGVGLSVDIGASTDGYRLAIDPISGQYIIMTGMSVSANFGAGASFAATVGLPYMNYSWLLPGSGMQQYHIMFIVV